MRIAMIIEAWKPIWGGGQVHVLELSKRLASKYNCRIDIYTMNTKWKSARNKQHIEFLNNNIRVIYTGKIRTFFSLKDRLFWVLEVISAIKKTHKKNSYTLIHAQATLPGLPGKILSKSLKIPIIYTVHGTNSLDLGRKNLFCLLEKILYTKIKYNAQISVSKKLLTYPNVNTPVIIPNGVDTKKFFCKNVRNSKSYFKILFVGRLDKIKGLSVLLKSINIIKEELLQKNARIDLVGYGYDKNIFETQVKILGLKNIVFFKGKKTKNKLLEEYCSSSLFILPSLSEGQPLTLLEAWATKLPVIVTDVGDNKYFVKNKINGYLVLPNNPELLAKTILEAINNPELSIMGKNGYKLIKKKYNWLKMTDKTYAIYKKFI